MTELGPSERRLLSALRAADEPTDEDHRRVHAAVLAQVAAGTGAATVVASETAQAATAGATGAAAKAVGVAALVTAHWKAALWVALLGAAGGAGTWWVSAAPTAPATPAEPVTTVSAHPVANSAPNDVDRVGRTPRPAAAEPKRAPAAAGSAAGERTKARSRPRANGASLDDELSLLGRAQQAMQQGNAERALQLLDEHAAEHPSGVLSQERAGVRAIALCRAGRLRQGRAAARRFLARSPNSPMAGRIRAACLERDD